MWDEIKDGLTIFKRSQKIEDLVSKLKNEAKIEIYEDIIESIK